MESKNELEIILDIFKIFKIFRKKFSGNVYRHNFFCSQASFACSKPTI